MVRVGGHRDHLDVSGQRLAREVGAERGEDAHPQPQPMGGDRRVVGGPARAEAARRLVERDVPDDDDVHRHGQSAICLAMISFMISEVPPPMVRRRMSRKNRSMGYSRM